jgi:DNA-binding NtrC family response regulator
MARHLHAKSRRAAQSFVSVNCAAIPENLLESELFGHEKGAFTGAVARRVGKFEEANGGTLLLDEISEMDPRLQAKLLRAIQEREIDRVGGTQPIKIDIRLIATTNRDLIAEVRAGRFREDLYFRLNVMTLKLPPLRERPKDIALLAEHFVRKYAEANGVTPRVLSPAALDILRAHAWHGNVRELENTMHRAVLLARGESVGPEAIMLSAGTREEVPAPAPSSNAAGLAASRAALVGRTVADVERDLILDTLHHCLGNRTHAANILGISIRTLRNKLKLYSEQGSSVPAPREGERATA